MVLQDHHWPGNVRQLENVMRHAVVRSGGRPVRMEHLPLSLHQAPRLSKHLTTKRQSLLTSETVSNAFEKVGGNRSRAAKLLGVSRATLYRFLSE
jgi:transcriptional regulator of acetoin/glycerol metabolism